MSRSTQVLLQAQDLDLLLHLALLKLQPGHVLIVDVLLLDLPRRDGAHELHERLARLSDRLGGELEALLRLRHEVRLDARGRDELCGGACDLVRRNDELLERVGAGEHAVCRLDEQVGGERDRAGGGYEAVRPAVVALVELLGRAGALALRDDLLLRVRRGFDEPPDRVRDRQRGREDRVVHLQVHGGEARRVVWPRDELLQALRRRFDRLGRAEHLLLDQIPNVPADRLGEGLALRNDHLDGFG